MATYFISITWEQNERWLMEAINRGDDFRFVSNPLKDENLYIYVNGVKTEELTTFGKEVNLLKREGYKITENGATKP